MNARPPRTATGRRREVVRAVVGAVAAVAATVAVIALLNRPKHHAAAPRRTQAAAHAYRDRMQRAFQPLVGDLPRLAQDVEDLDAGKLLPDAFIAVHSDEVAIAARGRDTVARTAGFPGDARPKELYWRSSQLYVEATQTFVDAARVDQPLRHQVVLAGKRTRVLADRIFDRGQKIIETAAGDPPNPDLVVKLPREVPDWAHEGMAAGPPIGTVTENHVTLDEAVDSRESQSLSAWHEAVDHDVVEVQRDARRLPGLAASTDPAAGARIAAKIDELVADADVVADPTHRREEFTTLRLAMVAHAEAARAFALAAVLPPAQAEIARRRGRDITLIGEAVWRVAYQGLRRPKGFAAPASHFDDAGLRVKAAL